LDNIILKNSEIQKDSSCKLDTYNGFLNSETQVKNDSNQLYKKIGVFASNNRERLHLIKYNGKIYYFVQLYNDKNLSLKKSYYGVEVKK
jgi:hypothetical protein